MTVIPAQAGYAVKLSAIQSAKRERLWMPASASMQTMTPRPLK